MSAESSLPRLYTERPIFQAVRELIRQTEACFPKGMKEQVRAILTGGTAMALYSPTRSSNDVDAIFSHRVVLPELLITYNDERGMRRQITWDRNYAPVLGLLHPEAEDQAIFVANSPDGVFDIRVLSPVDLAVTKVSRYADNDQRDIVELYRGGLIEPEQIEKRAVEALSYYVGNLEQVRYNLIDVLEKMGAKPKIPEIASSSLESQESDFRGTDAQRLARHKDSDMRTHCLADGKLHGKLMSLSEDLSVAFLARRGCLIAVYRSDFLPMPGLVKHKGRTVVLFQRGPETVVQRPGLEI
ncbi:DUF6036 family nucleotidyltransferase [Acidithiobacillus sp.]|uniref:DUF6036 family nucleotidyltransferase n=1 Tax=Acidithiobacillus sp. TaxID=1872118 RepID=UPI0025C6810A|nr:DUF6036 family nucleotidyltransferase [Acidithiobacillus sp.]